MTPVPTDVPMDEVRRRAQQWLDAHVPNGNRGTPHSRCPDVRERIVAIPPRSEIHDAGEHVYVKAWVQIPRT